MDAFGACVTTEDEGFVRRKSVPRKSLERPEEDVGIVKLEATSQSAYQVVS